MRLLCASDIHIGASSSLPFSPENPRDFRCSNSWERLVETAIAEKVDIMLLAGDVVDWENRYFEAMGPLETGIRKLDEAGIVVFAVAGNHDYNVLPELEQSFGGEVRGFHLLGKKGRWETKTWKKNGETLCIAGWSFPERHYKENPFDAGFPPSLPEGIPAIGLLHTDFGRVNSSYAPTMMENYIASGIDFWLIGHIHAPNLYEGRGVAVLNPGSPQALDSGEPGVHGAWIMEFGKGARSEPRQIPLSSVRYENVEIPLDGIEDEPGVREAISSALRKRKDEVKDEGGSRLEALICDLVFTGRTPMHGEVKKILDVWQSNGMTFRWELLVEVRKFIYNTRPAYDLEAAARAADPPGLLAGFLLKLERGELSDNDSKLVSDVLERIQEIHGLSYFSIKESGASSESPPALEDASRILYQTGLDLFDALMRQKQKRNKI